MNRYTDEELDKMYQEQVKKNTALLLRALGIIGIYVVGRWLAWSLATIFHNAIFIYLSLVIILYAEVIYCKRCFSRDLFHKTDILHNLLIPYCVQDLFGEEATYTRAQGIPRDLIEASHLVGGDWNTCRGSNLIQGTYMGVSFIQSDVTLTKYTESKDSEGNTTGKEVTIFQGSWAVLDFKKPFSTNLVVRERGEKFRDKWLDGKSTVTMENTVFNEKFIVIAEDAHNAFYLLTPHMMEHILQTEKHFMGRIYFCFMNWKIHIAIDNRKHGFDNISMSDGAANARKTIYGKLSLIPELMKQMKM